MILVINFGSNKTPRIHEIVNDFQDVTTVSFEEFQLDLLTDAKGVILSGAPLLITEMDLSTHLSKMEWILETTLPVLGICFGHQIIGILHGAFGSRIKEDRDWQEIDIFEDSKLFDKLPPSIQMMEDHCEAISIPPNFKLVGSSDACVNEAMEHHSKPIYGIQFHPEVSGNHGAIVIENFLKICV